MRVEDFLRETARRLPAKVALVAAGRRHTYAQIDTDSTRLAQHLRRRGVVPGDRVALFADNGVELVVAIFAALKAGAAFMPVNAQTKDAKLGRLLEDARPSCLVTSAALRGAWQGALSRNPGVKSCLVAGMSGDPVDPRAESLEAALAPGPADALPASIEPDALAALIYTSGTTGEPKGVMLSHASMVAAARSVNAYLNLHEDDVILCALPLPFSYGLYQVLIGFMVGATVVLEPSTFPVRMLETMVAERVTVFPAVPTLFSMLLGLENLGRYDLSRLRTITSASAPLAAHHVRALRARFPHAALYSMYGQTECKRATFLEPVEIDARPESLGRGMPGAEVWLEDEAGTRLPPGSQGELVVRSATVMLGYWERPEETALRLRDDPQPGVRVLHTGDIFRTDAEGYLYFVARKDDIIKTRGEKVSPREVESILYALEGVQEAAVVGVPDSVLGEAVKAFVVLRPGFQYTEREVLRHCQAALESFMVPKQIAFVGDLPKTDTGKIRKAGLG